MKKIISFAMALNLAVGLSGVAHAKSATPSSRKNVQAIQEPVEGEPKIIVPKGQLEEDVVDEEGLKRLGNFGKFHLFGYGELHYNGLIGPSKNEVDFHRLVLGLGYDFTDWLEFRSEVDFEHAFKEPELEFAQLDFKIRPWMNIRAGAFLVPVGIYNQHHEPPTFYSVERPELYRLIIPTSWQEAGAGIFGKFAGDFDYQLYFMSMPAAVRLSGSAIEGGFTGSEGIRGGRGGIGEQIARDWGASGRLQYRGVKGLRLGTSFVFGNTGQGESAIDGGLLTLLEADAKYVFQGFELDGAFAFTHLTDAGNINSFMTTLDPTFVDFVPTEAIGWYLEGAYHVFHHLLPQTSHDAVVFVRYEDIDTQFKMPTGFGKNPANDRSVLTFGASYLPIPQVAIKADYMMNWNKANGGVDQFNVGVGFYY